MCVKGRAEGSGKAVNILNAGASLILRVTEFGSTRILAAGALQNTTI